MTRRQREAEAFGRQLGRIYAKRLAKIIIDYLHEQGYTVKQQLQMHKRAHKRVAQAKKGRKV